MAIRCPPAAKHVFWLRLNNKHTFQRPDYYLLGCNLVGVFVGMSRSSSSLKPLLAEHFLGQLKFLNLKNTSDKVSGRTKRCLIQP